MSIDLRQNPLFSELNDDQIKALMASLGQRELKTGEILFNKGDAGDELIIVERGSLSIYVPAAEDPAKGQPVRVFKAGELFGEMALIDRKPRSLSARAEEAALVRTLSGEKFRAMLSQNPPMISGVMGGLNERLRYTTDFLGEVRAWIGKIAEGDYRAGDFITSDTYKEPTMAALAGEFARMAAEVSRREEELKSQIVKLQIQIDENKRKEEVQQIVGSEYYQDLKAKIRALREENQD